MSRQSKRFDTWMGTHVFGRVKIHIYDSQGDEDYDLDMPPAVYEELKRAIKEFEIDKERDLQRRVSEWDSQ